MREKPLHLLAVVSLLPMTPACVSVEQLAPPMAILQQYGPVENAASAARGRRLYLTPCAKCHSAEPVSDYSLDAWTARILPEMGREANLSSEELRDLENYILAVLSPHSM
jgi:mono/diheme cytochrome c family protein